MNYFAYIELNRNNNVPTVQFLEYVEEYCRESHWYCHCIGS